MNQLAMLENVMAMTAVMATQNLAQVRLKVVAKVVGSSAVLLMNRHLVVVRMIGTTRNLICAMVEKAVNAALLMQTLGIGVLKADVVVTSVKLAAASGTRALSAAWALLRPM